MLARRLLISAAIALAASPAWSAQAQESGSLALPSVPWSGAFVQVEPDEQRFLLSYTERWGHFRATFVGSAPLHSEQRDATIGETRTFGSPIEGRLFLGYDSSAKAWSDEAEIRANADAICEAAGLAPCDATVVLEHWDELRGRIEDRVACLEGYSHGLRHSRGSLDTRHRRKASPLGYRCERPLDEAHPFVADALLARRPGENDATLVARVCHHAGIAADACDAEGFARPENRAKLATYTRNKRHQAQVWRARVPDGKHSGWRSLDETLSAQPRGVWLVGVDGSIASQRIQAFSAADVSLDSQSRLQWAVRYGALLQRLGSRGGYIGLRGGIDYRRAGVFRGVERCRALPTTDPTVTATDCDDRQVLFGTLGRTTSGYAQLFLGHSFVHARARVIPTIEARLDLDGILQDEIIRGTILGLLGPGGRGPRLRFGIGAQMAHALYAQGANPTTGLEEVDHFDRLDLRAFALAGMSF